MQLLSSEPSRLLHQNCLQLGSLIFGSYQRFAVLAVLAAGKRLNMGGSAPGGMPC